MTRLVVSGWSQEIAKSLRKDAGELRIISPFIKVGTLQCLLTVKPKALKAITRFKLADFAEGVSDIAALRLLLVAGAQVHGENLLTFDHFGPSPEAAALVRVALCFKRDWARRRGFLEIFLCDSRFERFFVEAAEETGGVPGLRVSALRRGSETLGIEISLLCGDRLVDHVLAPNPDYFSQGVGGVLAEMTILNALKRRYAAVDFLPPS